MSLASDRARGRIRLMALAVIDSDLEDYGRLHNASLHVFNGCGHAIFR